MRGLYYIFLSLFVVLVIAQGVLAFDVFDINITEPTEGKTYDSASILFNLSVDNKSTFHYINDLKSTGRWIKICEKVKICEKKIRASEDQNKFTIKAEDIYGRINITKITFKVDSKKPKIHKIEPNGNSITNGSLFSIQYSEENLKEINLSYGNDDKFYSKLNSSDCDAGINKECNFTEINLTEFDGELIDFWFKVSDEVNSVLSRKTRVKVDTKEPEILYNSTTIDGKKVKFIFEIKEENFDEISYEDSNDCGLKFKESGVLCRNLQYGRCVTTKSFCLGEHKLKIFVKDKAGNSATVEKNISIET